MTGIEEIRRGEVTVACYSLGAVSSETLVRGAEDGKRVRVLEIRETVDNAAN